MKGRRFGRLLSWYPPYWGTGVRIRMADDYTSAEVTMKLRFYNRNYFGTHFGGSLYAMIDPHYTLLLVHRLGRGYRVWDQRATIDFLRPGRGTVTARFEVDDARLSEVRAATADGAKYTPTWPVDIVDADGTTVAHAEKTLYVRRARSAGRTG